MIEDRIKGLKFGLLMTGVRKSSYWIGFFFVPVVLSFTYFNPEAILPIILLTFATGVAYLAVFCIIGVLASSARHANIFILIYAVPGFVSSKETLSGVPSIINLLLCVNPHYAFKQYAILSAISPMGGAFSSTPIPYFAPSVNTLIITSLLFAVALSLLAIYIDSLQISQDERRSFFYPIVNLFRKSEKHKTVTEVKHAEPLIESSYVSDISASHKVSVKDLSKQYDGSITFALREVSFEFAKGEIFGLLGYNGAGKSTLINTLCGIISPTSGSINVFGLDPKTQRFEIASRTGICLQNDILYDELTVYEHLFYFGLIRGVPESSIKQKTEQIKLELNFTDSLLQSLTKGISEGQKRKLCVALAFINDPETPPKKIISIIWDQTEKS